MFIAQAVRIGFSGDCLHYIFLSFFVANSYQSPPPPVDYTKPAIPAPGFNFYGSPKAHQPATHPSVASAPPAPFVAPNTAPVAPGFKSPPVPSVGVNHYRRLSKDPY